MNASWKIGRFFGVVVRIHATFPLLLIWVVWLYYVEKHQWTDVATGVAFIFALLGSVTLHDLGHALMAKRLGIAVRDITLLPIGGVARFERLPRRPLEELWIALAGPAVNVVLAAILFAVLVLRGGTAEMETNLLTENFVARCLWINVGLALFNLLPAFPMDGGRILRAVLGLRFDYLRATNAAVLVGRAFAVVLGTVGLMANPFLLLIAVFVWFGAGQEDGATRLRSALEGVRVEDVMMTEFHALAPGEELQRAVDFALASRQQHFPVVAEGIVVGILRWEDLLSGLSEMGPASRVAEKMQTHVHTVLATDFVQGVLEQESVNEHRALPVMSEGRMVGLFTAENLLESIMLRSASQHGMQPAREFRPPVARRAISASEITRSAEAR